MQALMLPLSWAFGLVVSARGRRYDRRGAERVAGLTVLSVGNLAVGGTGKTPLAGAWARLLADQGLRVGILTRGTGGDEVALHKDWNPDVPVFVDADRVRAAERAAAEGIEVALLDDGFQHRRLARDLDVVLLAAEDPFPGPLLPAGPYRERPEGLSRAHVVVVTRRSASAERARAVENAAETLRAGAVMGRLHLEPSEWRLLDGRTCEPPTGDVLAVAGIARPADFGVSASEALGRPVEVMGFPDHHAFSERDLRRIQDRAGTRTVCVTEKDAVKLRRLRGAEDGALAAVVVLTQALRWESGEDEIMGLILGLVQ